MPDLATNQAVIIKDVAGTVVVAEITARGTRVRMGQERQSESDTSDAGEPTEPGVRPITARHDIVSYFEPRDTRELREGMVIASRSRRLP